MIRVAWVVAGLAAGAGAQGKAGLSAQEIYARHRDSVVSIEVTTSEGKFVGTGFFYGKGGSVATCYHVLEGAREIVVRGAGEGLGTPSPGRSTRPATRRSCTSTRPTPIASPRLCGPAPCRPSESPCS